MSAVDLCQNAIAELQKMTINDFIHAYSDFKEVKNNDFLVKSFDEFLSRYIECFRAGFLMLDLFPENIKRFSD